MKKLSYLLIIMATVCITNRSKAQAFDDGKNVISLGFGFPPTSALTETLDQYQAYDYYNYKNYGTLVLKYEHGLAKYFGIGLNTEYSAANVTYKYPTVVDLYQEKVNSSVLGFYLRFNAHYPVGDKLDIYAGVGLGYLLTINNASSNEPYSNTTKTQSLVFSSQFTLGLRYMIKDHFGLFAELGWASTTVQMGISLGF